MKNDSSLIAATSENIFKNVFFDLNKAILREESKIELNLFASYLKGHDGIKIELGGHTDSRGDEALNLTLSEARAAAVYKFLIERGIPAQRLAYKGYGSSSPIISDEKIGDMNNNSEKEAAHQQNRRTVWRETF